MADLDLRFFPIGTGAGQLSSKVMPVGFTPIHYSPVQIDGEGLDKESAHFKGIDNTIGGILGGGKVVQDFTTTNNQTEFITTASFSVDTRIEVFLDGALQRETIAYSRHESLNKIEMTENLPAGRWVEIVIYTTDPFVDNFVTGSTTSSRIVTYNITDDSNIELYIGGIKQKEGTSYTRDSSTDTINFIESIPSGYWVYIYIK